jgi:DNA-binding GntR family transcriptional regulator
MEVDSAFPPYAWIAWQLRDAIRAGTPGVGEPILSESELAEQYGVSRMTAGKVLGLLAAEGLIHRRRGAGSVVAQQISWERIPAEPGTIISVRLPTTSERAAVEAAAFVPLISIKKPGSAEQLYAADAIIVEATGGPTEWCAAD